MHYTIALVSVYFLCVVHGIPSKVSAIHIFTMSCLPQDEYAATPLIAASVENHIEVARFLVEHGASINYRTKVLGYSESVFLLLLMLFLLWFS